MIDACRLRREERYRACVDDVPFDCLHKTHRKGIHHYGWRHRCFDTLYRFDPICPFADRIKTRAIRQEFQPKKAVSPK